MGLVKCLCLLPLASCAAGLGCMLRPPLQSSAAPTCAGRLTLPRHSFHMQLPAVLMVALFSCFGLPAYSGARLAVVATLLWGFAPAALCLTYLLQAAFEVKEG